MIEGPPGLWYCFLRKSLILNWEEFLSVRVKVKFYALYIFIVLFDVIYFIDSILP